MSSLFHYALYANLFAYLQDFLFIRFIYCPPTKAVAVAIKGYFPTYYMYYYDLAELQQLAKALKDAKESGYEVWLKRAIGSTLFVRQILPMSGLYYVEILTGHVYGFLSGLFTVWTIEVIGAITCYLLSTFVRLCLCSNLWVYLQKAIALFDGSARSQRAFGIYPQYTSLRTRVISVFLLSLLRSMALVPNWMLNYAATELGVPFAEFLSSVFLGAFPHLYYSVHLGTRLLERTEPVDGSFRFFYLMAGLWNVIQVLLGVIILWCWQVRKYAYIVNIPVDHKKTPSAISNEVSPESQST